jgi:hypothetical protein
VPQKGSNSFKNFIKLKNSKINKKKKFKVQNFQKTSIFNYFFLISRFQNFKKFKILKGVVFPRALARGKQPLVG